VNLWGWGNEMERKGRKKRENRAIGIESSINELEDIPFEDNVKFKSENGYIVEMMGC